MPDQRSDPGRATGVASTSPLTVDAITRRVAQQYLAHPDGGSDASPRLIEAIELVLRMLERRAPPDAGTAGRGEGPQPEPVRWRDA